MCTSWNIAHRAGDDEGIITYWEMCTSWNVHAAIAPRHNIITYWEMCTSWNRTAKCIKGARNYNLLGNVH